MEGSSATILVEGSSKAVSTTPKWSEILKSSHAWRRRPGIRTQNLQTPVYHTVEKFGYVWVLYLLGVHSSKRYGINRTRIYLCIPATTRS